MQRCFSEKLQSYFSSFSTYDVTKLNKLHSIIVKCLAFTSLTYEICLQVLADNAMQFICVTSFRFKNNQKYMDVLLKTLTLTLFHDCNFYYKIFASPAVLDFIIVCNYLTNFDLRGIKRSTIGKSASMKIPRSQFVTRHRRQERKCERSNRNHGGQFNRVYRAATSMTDYSMRRILWDFSGAHDARSSPVNPMV